MPCGKTKRSAQGAGNIRKRTVTKSNGKSYTYWEGRYSMGYDPLTGKQIQHTISGKTQKEVAQKLREVTAEIDQDVYVKPTNMLLSQWMDEWQRDYLFGVKPSTAEL